jgi:hypothetical protein
MNRRASVQALGGALVGTALLSGGTLRPAGATAAQEESDCESTPEDSATPGPNLYELTGPSLTVTYSTSSIAGEPQLVLADSSGEHTFAGDVIRVQETAIGKLVTVELEYIPDAGAELFSLLLPAVGQVAVAPKIAALAIYTTEQTTMEGSAGIEGAIQLYRVVEVQGTARSVVF